MVLRWTAHEVRQTAGRLHETAQDLNGQRRIRLRLVANSAASSAFPPAALGPLLAEYPELDLDLVERSSVEILQAVRSGAVEMGVLDGNLSIRASASAPP